MSDETKTRVETVSDNIDAVIEKRGEEAHQWIAQQCLIDISVSLAMLVDAGASSAAAETTPAKSTPSGNDSEET